MTWPRQNLLLLVMAASLASACGSSGAKTPALPGTLLDEQMVMVSPNKASNVTLGKGAQTATLTFPVGATSTPETIEVALSSGVDKQGGTPANGTVVQIVNLNLTFSSPVTMTLVLPPAPSGQTYFAAHAQATDAAWTIGGPATDAGAAPATDGGMATGLELFSIDVTGTGIWTIVLQSNSDAGQVSDGGTAGMGSGGQGGLDAAAGTGGNTGPAGSDGGGGVAGNDAGTDIATTDGGEDVASVDAADGGAPADAAEAGSDAMPGDGAVDGNQADGSTGPTGVGSFKQIALNYQDGHACALRTDGTVTCWGANGSSQSAPVPSGTFTQVAVGRAVSCALATNQTIACWGAATVAGQVPSGSFASISLDAENLSACALKADGTPVCWGNSTFPTSSGPLTAISSDNPYVAIKATDGTLIGSGALAGTPAGSFTQVSAFQNHACGVKSDGSVACWGNNGSGETTAPTGTGFTEVSVGPSFSCGVKKGAVLCWGDNSWSQSSPPRGTFVHITTGKGQACGVLTTGGVLCWGRAQVAPAPLLHVSTEFGFTCGLGVDGTVLCWDPAGSDIMSSPPTGSFVDVGIASGTACAVRSDMSAVCWGSSVSAPTGNNYTRIVPGPETDYALTTNGTLTAGPSTPAPPAGSFVDVCWGDGANPCAVSTAGTLSCWGYAPPTPPAGSFKQVACGDNHWCAVGSDGTPVCWGTAASGDTTAPTNMRVLQVAAGTSHSCAIVSDGTLDCWGDNSLGQSAPPNGTFKQISAAGNHTCGIDSNQQIWCWGDFVLSPP
jgi:alpha-tubulin suppressor-like RCC1 family protein